MSRRVDRQTRRSVALGLIFDVVTWTDDLAGSTNTDQWVGALSGAGGALTPIQINSAILQWATGVVAPEITQSTAAAASAPQNLLLAPQPPNAGATNATNGTPGSLVVGLGSPVNGGSEAHLKVVETSQTVFQVGSLDGTAGNTAALHLLPAAYGGGLPPSGSNYALSIDASLNLVFNAPGARLLFQSASSASFAFVANPANKSLQLCSALESYGGGTGVVGVTNASVAPTSNPSGGGILYSTAGAGTWRGSSGTVTTFGPAEPHCPVCGKDFVTEHYNEKYGYLSVCLACLADHLGEQPYLIRDRAHRTDKPTRKHPGKGRLSSRSHVPTAAIAAAAATIGTLIAHFWR